MVQKGANPLPKAYSWGGAYSEPWGVRALTIIGYWFRGPKAVFTFMLKGRGHFNPIRSSFVIVVPSLFHPPFNSKHKNAFHWEPRHFLLMLEKRKVS